jgi:hypothetical protein
VFTLRHEECLRVTQKILDCIAVAKANIVAKSILRLRRHALNRAGAKNEAAVPSSSSRVLKRQRERASRLQGAPGGIDRRACCCTIFWFIVGSAMRGSPAFRAKSSSPQTLSDAHGDYVIVAGWVLTTHDLTSGDRSA